jgi:hypothetical protein
LEYIGWQDISFKENGTELAPRLKSGFLYDIHPKIGLMYTDEGSGAHLRFGLNTSAFLDRSGLSPQYHLSLGIGGKALHIIEIEASVVDSYLFSFINRQQRVIEIIQLGIEYQFE